MVRDEYPQLRSWLDLFEDDPLVFRIGEHLVSFQRDVAEDGYVQGWHVTTEDPNYSGYLVRERGVVRSPQGLEAERTYSFEVTGPRPLRAEPAPVFLSEFKEIFFGERHDDAA